MKGITINRLKSASKYIIVDLIVRLLSIQFWPVSSKSAECLSWINWMVDFPLFVGSRVLQPRFYVLVVFIFVVVCLIDTIELGH